jgi:hypothetical protein
MTTTFSTTMNRALALPRRTAAKKTICYKRPRENQAMPLFPCSKCNCIEDTALCHYWSARLRQTSAVCSACDPAIGKWHGEFPKESAEGWIRDRSGFLLDKGSVERWLGQPVEMFAKSGQEPCEGRDAVKAHLLALDAASYGTSAT